MHAHVQVSEENGYTGKLFITNMVNRKASRNVQVKFCGGVVSKDLNLVPLLIKNLKQYIKKSNISSFTKISI